MRELSKAMKRALGKLSNNWQSASVLDESKQTLNALKARGLVERRGLLGATIPGFSRTSTEYRLKPE